MNARVAMRMTTMLTSSTAPMMMKSPDRMKILRQNRQMQLAYHKIISRGRLIGASRFAALGLLT
jgi:hypothetical protein